MFWYVFYVSVEEKIRTLLLCKCPWWGADSEKNRLDCELVMYRGGDGKINELLHRVWNVVSGWKD